MRNSLYIWLFTALGFLSRCGYPITTRCINPFATVRFLAAWLDELCPFSLLKRWTPLSYISHFHRCMWSSPVSAIIFTWTQFYMHSIIDGKRSILTRLLRMCFSFPKKVWLLRPQLVHMVAACKNVLYRLRSISWLCLCPIKSLMRSPCSDRTYLQRQRLISELVSGPRSDIIGRC